MHTLAPFFATLIKKSDTVRLVEMNAAAVSRVQLSHMAEIRAKVLPAFGAVLRSLLTNQEPA